MLELNTRKETLKGDIEIFIEENKIHASDSKFLSVNHGDEI